MLRCLFAITSYQFRRDEREGRVPLFRICSDGQVDEIVADADAASMLRRLDPPLEHSLYTVGRRL